MPIKFTPDTFDPEMIATVPCWRGSMLITPAELWTKYYKLPGQVVDLAGLTKIDDEVEGGSEREQEKERSKK